MSIDEGNDKQRIIALITKLHNGEATEEEIREIDQWYDHPTSSAKYADGLSLQQKSKAKDAIFQKINNQIGHQQLVPHKTIFYRLLKAMPYAAVFFLAVGIGFYFVYKTQQGGNNSQITKISVHQNHDKATLTLSNGNQIILAGTKNGVFANQGNATIIKRSNGQIVYNSDQTVNNTTAYNTMTTPRGGEYHVTLSDGTNVWLNAASSLKYPTVFSGRSREVELSGEAYFEVAHDASHPFKVVTKKQSIEVLGTHFNVNAYDNESITKTTLLQGAVRVAANGAFKLLKPGQQSSVNQRGIEIANVDTQEAVAWKDGFFDFTDADVETIMRQVSRWYDVDVVYNGKIPTETFTGRVSKFLNINQVLALVQSANIHLTYDGRRIMVKQ